MDKKRAVALSLAGAASVFAATLYWYGTGPEGAVVAARSTARFSGVVFALALALRTRPSHGASLMYSFVAAHTVHYASVAYLAAVATQHHLHRLSVRSVFVVVFGTLLLVLIALTTDASSAGVRRLNVFAVSLAWLTFLGGAALNAPSHWPAAIPAVLLVGALAYHIYRRRQQRRSRAPLAASS